MKKAVKYPRLLQLPILPGQAVNFITHSYIMCLMELTRQSIHSHTGKNAAEDPSGQMFWLYQVAHQAQWLRASKTVIALLLSQNAQRPLFHLLGLCGGFIES